MNFKVWFNEVISKLDKRAVSFRKIIQYLDTLPDPIIILETGCLRKIDSFSGDGQSTLIFDKYTQYRGNKSKVYSVDISEQNVNLCKSIVSEKVYLKNEDSINFISNFHNLLDSKQKLSLLYLDSFDVNWDYPLESSAHHLKELTASIPHIDKNTLVVIDDAPINLLGYRDENNNFKLIKETGIGGKGILVHEYAKSVNAEIFFSHYQVGYKNII
jgi:hypothetical protein